MALPRPSVVFVEPPQAVGFVRTDELPQVLRVPGTETEFISTNVAGPQGPPGPAGGGSASFQWSDYAINFDPANPPVFLETTPTGDVYQYTYTNGTLYRLVGPSDDAFYVSFSSPNVSGLVVGRATTI